MIIIFIIIVITGMIIITHGARVFRSQTCQMNCKLFCSYGSFRRLSAITSAIGPRPILSVPQQGPQAHR